MGIKARPPPRLAARQPQAGSKQPRDLARLRALDRPAEAEPFEARAKRADAQGCDAADREGLRLWLDERRR